MNGVVNLCLHPLLKLKDVPCPPPKLFSSHLVLKNTALEIFTPLSPCKVFACFYVSKNNLYATASGAKD